MSDGQKCSNPISAKQDVVTGEYYYQYCSSERASKEKCGKLGNYWEFRKI